MIRIPARLVHAPSVVTLLAALFATSATTSQSQFRQLRKEGFDPQLPGVSSLAIADIDGDGDVDVVAGARAPAVYRGLGGGRFALDTTSIPSGQYAPREMLLVDVDGDNDLDLVIANDFYTDRLLLNDGTGRFAFAAFPVDSKRTRGVTAVDVDGDNDLDLAFADATAVSGGGSPNRLYLNDGRGTFSDARSQLPRTSEATLRVVVDDVDGDGDRDWLNVNYPGNPGSTNSRPYSLWLNDGSGNFTDATSTNLPTDGVQGSDAAFTDVDGNGVRDLFVAADQKNNDRDTVYTNNGSGIFRRSFRVLAGDARTASSLAVGDVDGDGDDDAVADDQDGTRLLTNDGFGRFALASSSRVSPAQEITPQLKLADIDGDGDLDLVAATLGGVALQVNDGLGTFVDGSSTGFPSRYDRSYAVASADLDGDGDGDAVFGTSRGVRLYWQVAPGRFRSDARRDLFGQVNAIVPTDLDRDGDIDLVIGGYRMLLVWSNDGRGSFTDVTRSSLPFLNSSDAEDLAVADVDGDGDLDFVVVRRGRTNRNSVLLLLNRGNGTFDDATANRVPTLADGSFGLGLADVDADSDLDIVVGNGGTFGGEQNRLLLNDGTGRFSDQSGRLPQLTDATTSLALADLTGDGMPELIVANSGERNRLHLNLGNGSFFDATIRFLGADNADSRDVVVADFDGDPDLEMLFAQDDSQPAVGGYYDAGPNGWHRVRGASPEPGFGSAVTASDVDGDGDQDALVATRFGDDTIWRNLQGHTHAPDVARLGGNYRLQFFAAPNGIAVARSAVPLLSLVPASRDILIPPIGILRLDPGSLVPLPPIAIPFQAPATVTLPIPASASIAGLQLYTQGVILHGAQLLDARLTNLVVDRLQR